MLHGTPSGRSLITPYPIAGVRPSPPFGAETAPAKCAASNAGSTIDMKP